MKRYLSSGLLVGLVCLAGAARAEDNAPIRLRATIDAVDGRVLHLTERNGDKLILTLAADTKVTEVTSIDIGAIKPSAYIGTAAMPMADGTQRALEVLVFPDSMRGAGEGHRPWDLQPGSTMTNGTVGSVVGTSERTLTVKYGADEKKVLVPVGVPIVTFEPSDMKALKPGAHIITVATKAPDGSFGADRVNVGKDGLTPPM